MSTGKVVLGTLAGLAIGGVAGILFAPEKGSITRRKIMEKAEDYEDKIKSKVDEIRDSVAEKFERTKNEAEDLVEKEKAKFNETRKDVKDAASNFKNNVATEMKHATT